MGRPGCPPCSYPDRPPSTLLPDSRLLCLGSILDVLGAGSEALPRQLQGPSLRGLEWGPQILRAGLVVRVPMGNRRNTWTG